VDYKYSYTLSLTSALEGVGGQLHAPAALHPGKSRHPLYRSLGGPQGRYGRVRKILPPLGFDPRTAQPVASRYTATPAFSVHVVLTFRITGSILSFLRGVVLNFTLGHLYVYLSNLTDNHNRDSTCGVATRLRVNEDG